MHAVESMLDRLGVSAGQYYRDVKALFFHRPYHLMPIQAMSFGLDAKSMARGQYWIHPAMPELVENALLNLPGLSDGSITVVDMKSEKAIGSMDTLKNMGMNPNCIVLLPKWNDLAGH